jgi:hypothetical protein
MIINAASGKLEAEAINCKLLIVNWLTGINRNPVYNLHLTDDSLASSIFASGSSQSAIGFFHPNSD